MLSLPKILLIGGPDIDARLELMHHSKDTFSISALGSLPTLHDRFLAEGFRYNSYRLDRQVNPLSDLWTLCQLVFIFRRLEPQIVHTFDTKPGVWARLAARLAGVPIIIGTLPGLGSLYANDVLKTRFFRSVYQPLQTLAYRISDLTIYQNHDNARQFIAAGIVSEQKATVIFGSGISTDVFAQARISDIEKAQLRAELDIQPYETVVTMVSRLIRSKGVLEFMAAAQEVGNRCPNVCFLLVGPHDHDSVDRLSVQNLPNSISPLSGQVPDVIYRLFWPCPMFLFCQLLMAKAFHAFCWRRLLWDCQLSPPILRVVTRWSNMASTVSWYRCVTLQPSSGQLPVW